MRIVASCYIVDVEQVQCCPNLQQIYLNVQPPPTQAMDAVFPSRSCGRPHDLKTPSNDRRESEIRSFARAGFRMLGLGEDGIVIGCDLGNRTAQAFHGETVGLIFELGDAEG